MKPEDDNCPNCGSENYYLASECGVRVCDDCDHHEKLQRCFCGWSRRGEDGRRELEELGEVIDSY